MYVCTQSLLIVWKYVCTNVGLLMLHTSAESVFTGDIRTLYLHMYNYISEHCTVTCSNIHCPLTIFNPHRGLSLSLKLTLLKEPTSDCREAWRRYVHMSDSLVS